MSNEGIERRTCVRFEIPGSTVTYKLDKLFTPGEPKKYGEEFCPILDISRGGIRFVCQKPFKISQKIIMKISIPGERSPVVFHGQVRWASSNAGKSYRYQIGVQFSPYGEKKGQNYPGNLVKIIALEQKFVSLDAKDMVGDNSGGGFEIDE